jgi:YidC/Oxa1 family membrane protein insertase
MDIFAIILWPIKWLVELILVAFHWLWTSIGMDPNAGATWVLAIVGLVIVVRAALIPVFVRQIKSQRKMLEIAPELKKIQDKYKGKRDQYSRENMSRETMALYGKHGTNPLSSCLPILLQMPIFFALFSVLNDAQKGAAGVGPLDAKLAVSFADASIFGVAPLHASFQGALNSNPVNVTVMIIAAVMVVLMTASQFITQLQIRIFKHGDRRDKLSQIVDSELLTEGFSHVSFRHHGFLRAHSLLYSSRDENERRVDSRKVLEDFCGFFR